MRDSDQQIVRRVLSSVLDRLDAGASPDQAQSYQDADKHNGDGDNSIILVVMGQGVNASSARARDEKVQVEKVQVDERRRMQATHPVFERFPVAEEETVSPAPKTCFMEPGRVCVNSGACEMRGY